MTQGDSLLVNDGGRHFLGLLKAAKNTFGYAIWCIIGIFFGVADGNI